MNYVNLFKECKEEGLNGRYITNKHIEPLLENISRIFEVSTIGFSVKEQPIYSVKIGSGKTKIYMWSQMHGNESTTTKALFDLFNLLKLNTPFALEMKRNFTLFCIPILNPDGAESYTRENANKVDLNRDLYNLSQPESQLLRKVYNEFKPDYCFNLHDQRTIYAAGNTNNPATVAFLAPAYNESRDINEVRRKAIRVIVAMNNELQKHIPNQVGRFDDAFNINCAGETFQALNTPTILFESGHFPNDYQREETRKYIFVSLVTGLHTINENVIVDDEIQDYLNIPQNYSIFFDFLYKKVKIYCDSLFLIINFAAQFEEVLVDGDIVFEARITQVGELNGFYGHQEYNCEEAIYSDDFNNIPEIDKKANFCLNKSTKIVNGLINL